MPQAVGNRELKGIGISSEPSAEQSVSEQQADQSVDEQTQGQSSSSPSSSSAGSAAPGSGTPVIPMATHRAVERHANPLQFSHLRRVPHSRSRRASHDTVFPSRRSEVDALQSVRPATAHPLLSAPSPRRKTRRDTATARPDITHARPRRTWLHKLFSSAVFGVVCGVGVGYLFGQHFGYLAGFDSGFEHGALLDARSISYARRCRRHRTKR